MCVDGVTGGRLIRFATFWFRGRVRVSHDALQFHRLPEFRLRSNARTRSIFEFSRPWRRNCPFRERVSISFGSVDHFPLGRGLVSVPRTSVDHDPSLPLRRPVRSRPSGFSFGRSPANRLSSRHIAIEVKDLNTIVDGPRDRGCATIGDVRDFEDIDRL